MDFERLWPLPRTRPSRTFRPHVLDTPAHACTDIPSNGRARARHGRGAHHPRCTGASAIKGHPSPSWQLAPLPPPLNRTLLCSRAPSPSSSSAPARNPTGAPPRRQHGVDRLLLSFLLPQLSLSPPVLTSVSFLLRNDGGHGAVFSKSGCAYVSVELRLPRISDGHGMPHKGGGTLLTLLGLFPISGDLSIHFRRSSGEAPVSSVEIGRAHV